MVAMDILSSTALVQFSDVSLFLKEQHFSIKLLWVCCCPGPLLSQLSCSETK